MTEELSIKRVKTDTKQLLGGILIGFGWFNQVLPL